ncbi:hypothetical protein FLAN108750_04390 [Flavobacterium antarcticum]|uniref:hypothetical protein n=1 Tax=Flavobacterium antarcticum TaxID=271155 RepID=UPI0003B3DFF5|nr:hypothetical protein [Flavobacterium antarcticum]
MRSKLFLIILLCSSAAVFAQKEKLIQGKISVKDSKLEGIRVINLVNEKEAITDEAGNFSILAKPDDLLVFSAEFLDYMRMIVEESDYNKGSIEIKMTSKVLQLDEVQIYENARINAVALGILSSPAKVYTPAERRLRTATELDASLNVGTMAGGSIGLDPLMNWISGRTAMLKRALKAEEKEILLEKLEFNYTDAFFTEKLGIETLYLGTFKNYAIYDAVLIEAITSKNKPRMEFNLYRIATEFKKRNDYEK